jgi:hypothetical protein
MKALHIGILDLGNGVEQLYISTVPCDDEKFDVEHITVVVPKGRPASIELTVVANVLSASGAQITYD